MTPGPEIDLGHAVEIADRVWWVGMHMPDDHFQCHVYLLEHGDQSVLFDPGGLLTFDHVFQKVTEVVSFDQIRWFVCHHEDPDITASVIRIDALVTRPGRGTRHPLACGRAAEALRIEAPVLADRRARLGTRPRAAGNSSSCSRRTSISGRVHHVRRADRNPLLERPLRRLHR